MSASLVGSEMCIRDRRFPAELQAPCQGLRCACPCLQPPLAGVVKPTDDFPQAGVLWLPAGSPGSVLMAFVLDGA
eukprot:14532349-Alexandrium_andersonii.AAC.1